MKVRRSSSRRVVEFAALEARRLMCAVDSTGNIITSGTDPYPTMPSPPATLAATTGGGASAVASASLPLTSVPALHSDPGASAKIYLDFTGAAATTWGSYSVPATPAYDTDGDPTTFSSTELANVQQIWARVSEKYSPFNIDVTTVDPGSYGNDVAQRVVIGGAGAWLGAAAGGVSYVGAFSNSAPNTSWVFPANLGGGYPQYVGEAAAHEAGHAFGLQHQSTYSGTTKTNEYNPGTSASAPIMGDSYTATRGLWWFGTSSVSSTTMQDDMSVIASSANGFGYRPDDYGNTFGAAQPLALSGSTIGASGVISTTADNDYFSFTAGAGALTLSVNPVSGGMLDARLALYSSSGALVASSDSGLSESLSLSVPAGTYYADVSSHGNYGDVGQYTFSGTVAPPPVAQPPAAPSGLAAVAASPTQVNLSWADNSSNESGFRIERSSDGVNFGEIAITAANATSYSDTTVSGGGSYIYRVRAYNATGTSAYTAPASVTTPIPPPPQPPAGTVLTGAAYGTAGSWNNLGNTYAKALDGNLATYFDAPTASGDYVGLDLGTPAAVGSIRFAPRAGAASRMVGGRFQGSNVSATSGFVDLYTITAAPADGALTSVNVTDPTAYRWVRYLAPNGGYGNIAELSFIAAGTASTGTATQTGTLLSGAGFGTAGSWLNDGNTFDKAIDGDASSFFDAPAGSGDYVGLDLGTPSAIGSIRFAPRAGYEARMVGGVFQGSNSSATGGYVNLYTITAAPVGGALTTVTVSDPTAYRWVRYLAPDGSYGNVAEVQFISAPSSAGASTVAAKRSTVVPHAAHRSAMDSVALSHATPAGGIFSAEPLSPLAPWADGVESELLLG